MSVGEYCNREVIVTTSEADIVEAAKLMRKYHVGDLVVVEKRGEESVPIGIVTDRDLVIEVLAQEVPLSSVTVRDVMSHGVVIAQEQDDLWETLNRMRSEGIRRLPVVDTTGSLAGILTADDVLELLSEGLLDLTRLVRREIDREVSVRR